MEKCKTEGLNHKLELLPKKEWRAALAKDAFPSHNTKTAATVSPFKLTQSCLTPHTSLQFLLEQDYSCITTLILPFGHNKLQNFKGVNMSKVAKSSIEQYFLSKQV